MNFNLDRFEKGSNFIEELKDIAARYPGYKAVMPSQVKYHDIENEMQEKISKKAGDSKITPIALGTIAFGACAVWALLVGQTAIAIVSAIIALLLVYFLVSTIISKPKVALGKAVWKKSEYTNFKNSRAKIYFVYVALDGPEKIICQRIQTSKEDYDSIVEGTQIVIVKNGSLYHASIYHEQ